MFKNNISIILVLILVVVFVGAYTFKTVYDKKHAINETTKEIFSDSNDNSVYYTDINGNNVSLEQYLGKVMVVNSWASWSPFSTNELTSLSELSSDYNKDDVVFLAINRKESREQAQRFVNTLPDTKSLLIIIDLRDHFYSTIGGYTMPETVIYDKKGNIVEHIHGTHNKDDVKKKVDELLQN
jgi:thiol-disulfide isomerase/thioredoxin